MSIAGELEWLLLLYLLPSKAADARVQAWRRLQRIGAVSLKNSAYVLPNSSEAREDFEWIKNEVVESGGEAVVLIARAPDQTTHEELVNALQLARRKDFEDLAADATALVKRLGSKDAKRTRRQITQRVRRLRERFDETVRQDFFAAPERERVAGLLRQLEQQMGRGTQVSPSSEKAVKTGGYRGKRWLTRPRPGVDRMSSAWLIQRFVDRDATFVFGETAAVADAIPFDTFQAEFGHHGSNCTFETLCERFAIDDSRVRYIGRIVHDLDLKEKKYGEVETETVGRLVEGLRQTHTGDQRLLRSGMDMFEALFQ